jgi:histidine triad (HIT) family protein
LIGSHQWPQNPGNTIIVPNQHYENVYELPPGLGTPIQRLVQQVARAMKTAWNCDGVSTRQHNEPAGSQDVWHYHVHVTPRYRNDNFYGSKRELMPPAERVQLANELREALK